MTPASSPAPDDPLPTAPELANQARDFRLRMAVIDSETEPALGMTRDRYGRTVHAGAAAAARAHRDKAAVEAYATHLAPHAEALLDAARLVLDELLPALHLTGWRAVWTAWLPPPPNSAEPSTGRPRPAPPPNALSTRPCGHTSPLGRTTALSPATSPISATAAPQGSADRRGAADVDREGPGRAAARRAEADRVVVCRRRAVDHPRLPGRLGRRRWVIERTMSWLGYRRLSPRYERDPRNYLAFLGLAPALCCYKRLIRHTT